MASSVSTQPAAAKFSPTALAMPLFPLANVVNPLQKSHLEDDTVSTNSSTSSENSMAVAGPATTYHSPQDGTTVRVTPLSQDEDMQVIIERAYQQQYEVGTTMVRVRFEPRTQVGPTVWNKSCEQPLMVKVAHAKAVQVNAESAQPNSNLDMYTSRNYGESGITVTLAVPTSKESAEPPVLDIQVVLVSSH